MPRKSPQLCAVAQCAVAQFAQLTATPYDTAHNCAYATAQLRNNCALAGAQLCAVARAQYFFEGAQLRSCLVRSCAQLRSEFYETDALISFLEAMPGGKSLYMP
jgi:hypothetical protein